MHYVHLRRYEQTFPSFQVLRGALCEVVGVESTNEKQQQQPPHCRAAVGTWLGLTAGLRLRSWVGYLTEILLCVSAGHDFTLELSDGSVYGLDCSVIGACFVRNTFDTDGWNGNSRSCDLECVLSNLPASRPRPRNHHRDLASAETTTTRTSPTPTPPPGPNGGDPAHHLRQRPGPMPPPLAGVEPAMSRGGPGPIAPRAGAAAGAAQKTGAGGPGGDARRVTTATTTTLAGNEREGREEPGPEREGPGPAGAAAVRDAGRETTAAAAVAGRIVEEGRSGERLCTGPGRRSGR